MVHVLRPVLDSPSPYNDAAGLLTFDYATLQ
jgi:hypothetical protein